MAKNGQFEQEVAKAVGAGKTAVLGTVDFNDPNRPKTCLEVDFPILSINQVAIIEGNAGKPMIRWCGAFGSARFIGLTRIFGRAEPAGFLNAGAE